MSKEEVRCKERHMGDAAYVCPVFRLNEWVQEQRRSVWRELDAGTIFPTQFNAPVAWVGSISPFPCCHKHGQNREHIRRSLAHLCVLYLPTGGREGGCSRDWGALSKGVRAWIAEERMPPTCSDSNLDWWEAGFKVCEKIFCSPVASTCYFLIYFHAEFNLICFCVAGSEPLRPVNAFR